MKIEIKELNDDLESTDLGGEEDVIVAHRPETIRSAGRVIDISNTESITIKTRKHDESEKYY